MAPAPPAPDRRCAPRGAPRTLGRRLEEEHLQPAAGGAPEVRARRDHAGVVAHQHVAGRAAGRAGRRSGGPSGSTCGDQQPRGVARLDGSARSARRQLVVELDPHRARQSSAGSALGVMARSVSRRGGERRSSRLAQQPAPTAAADAADGDERPSAARPPRATARRAALVPGAPLAHRAAAVALAVETETAALVVAAPEVRAQVAVEELDAQLRRGLLPGSPDQVVPLVGAHARAWSRSAAGRAVPPASPSRAGAACRQAAQRASSSAATARTSSSPLPSAASQSAGPRLASTTSADARDVGEALERLETALELGRGVDVGVHEQQRGLETGGAPGRHRDRAAGPAAGVKQEVVHDSIIRAPCSRRMAAGPRRRAAGVARDSRPTAR